MIGKMSLLKTLTRSTPERRRVALLTLLSFIALC